jgi:hypothetical protein
MAKPRGPQIPRLGKVRTEADMRRDLRRQFEPMFQRWDAWSKPSADSIRAATESHVRRGGREEHAGNPKVSGPGLRSRWSRKQKFAGTSLI